MNEGTVERVFVGGGGGGTDRYRQYSQRILIDFRRKGSCYTLLETNNEHETLSFLTNIISVSCDVADPVIKTVCFVISNTLVWRQWRDESSGGGGG
jgi:hypothetical protein